jgi:D-inositol-3-phosphate glycosyltransferase
MRIALVTGIDIAGMNEASSDEQRGLADALRGAGQQVTEHVLEGGPGADARAAVPGFAAALRSRWAQERPDVVHALGWASGLAALAAARDAGLPVVTTLGSLAMTERRHGLLPELERARLERAIGQASRAVISPSSEAAADLVRMGVSRRRVHVIPAGVDVAQFTPDGPVAGRTAVRGAGPQAAKPRIVTVADPDDDQAAALAQAVGAVPGAELITCPGAGARDGDLAALLRSADVFAHVPAHAPRGVAVLRAMACGVPVVASAVGAHVDMVIEGTTGILVRPGRPDLLAARIRHLLSHPMLRQGCSVAAVDRARSRYSWDRVAAETLAVYESAAGTQLAAAA